MGGGSGSLTTRLVRQGEPAHPLDLSLAVAAAAIAKKARDIVILDMRKLVAYTDYMVVCTGSTPRQTKAISDEMRLQLKQEQGFLPQHVEGDQEGEWILLDLLDVVAHVFTPQAREFYRLDRLWREAPREEFEAAVS